MRRDRWVTTALIATVAFAACVEGLRLAETEQFDVTTTTSPSTDFGQVPVNTTSSAIAITVGPSTGTNMDTVDGVDRSGCGSDFQLSFPAPPVEVGQDCGSGSGSGTGTASAMIASGSGVCSVPTTFTITATFTPHSTVPQSCPITISVDGGAMNQFVTLTGQGKPPPFGADVEPKAIAFGSVRVGDASNPQNATITNTGANMLPIQSLTLSDPAYKLGSGVNAGAHAIAPGTSELDGIVCTPGSAADFPAKLTVTFGSASALAPQLVSLTCTGVQSNLSIPSPASFADMRVGDAAATLPIVITNKGSGNAIIDGISLAAVTGDLTYLGGPMQGVSIPPNQNLVVQVEYRPTAPNKGKLGTLQVMHDSGQESDVLIQGNALTAAMSVTPDGLFDFGAVCIGDSAAEMFTIAKTDEGFFSLDTVTVGDTSQFDVTFTGGNVDPTLPFMASVMPKSEGLQMTPMTITTDIPGLAPHVVMLQTEAFAAGINATPSAVEFGGVTVDTVSQEKDVTLTNCGSGAIAVTAATIDPIGDFDVSNTEWMTTLQPTQSASFHLLFTPHRAGIDQATLHVTFDGGGSDIALSGTGDGTGSGSDIGGGGKDTYYACNAGGVSAWPAAVAWLLARRRRRRR